IAAAIRHHHEAYNGMGYPDQLIGNEIPLFARIIAVCDSYDAMISDRPYRVGMEPHEARAILVLDNGCQWDEDIVAILLGVLTARPSVLA
ncbi:MAG: HD domain-containing protein, partial [Chloroflexota bacterium]|nr:HD domain-containing protein [Chloroflexota bacterium]